jgi:DNA (cytosine-5)-methyltransferase 1
MTLATCIDLFAGTGAFSHVLQQQGIKCVFANDMESSSEAIYNANHTDNVFLKKDLNEIDTKSDTIPPHDLLCGGFPCQPFSIAGKQQGFQDSRANVFWKIIEILHVHQPKVIILENVKNLTTHDKQNTFTVIREELEKLGYHLNYKVLDTCKVSEIPQHRERIYIVGFLDKMLCERFHFDFDTCIQNRPLCELLQTNVPEKYYYTDKLVVFDKVKEGVKEHISTNTLYQYRRYYVRENKNNCCPTLTANMGSGGHNVPLLRDDHGIRKLTPRECFNLQGFPSDYQLPALSDSALYKLAGNAVSVPVVECIVKQLVGVMKNMSDVDVDVESDSATVEPSAIQE